MFTSIGTKQWLIKSEGKLGFRDRLSMIFQGVKAKALTSKQIKSGYKVRYINLDQVIPPDTDICTEAMLLSHESSHPYLFNHCMRAYFWARLLNDNHHFDDEATFTAIMLHDLGLTERYRLNNSNQQCFTFPAAKVAEELANKHQWSDKRAATVSNAITLHLNVVVDAKHGREARLVRMGSGADVAGLGLHLLHRRQIDQVVKKYPRINMKESIKNDLAIEAANRPCCRAAFLMNKLGFEQLIEGAPFHE